jgi:hypothetical protein
LPACFLEEDLAQPEGVDGEFVAILLWRLLGHFLTPRQIAVSSLLSSGRGKSKILATLILANGVPADFC